MNLDQLASSAFPVISYVPPAHTDAFLVCTILAFILGSWMLGEAIEARGNGLGLRLSWDLSRRERLSRCYLACLPTLSTFVGFAVAFGLYQSAVRIPMYFITQYGAEGYAAALAIWSLLAIPMAAAVSWLFIRRTKNQVPVEDVTHADA